MFRVLCHLVLVIVLTLVTQLGGLAWGLALAFKRRWIAFPVIYVLLSVLALWIAPIFGRVPISCLERGALQMHSMMYCALNRNYVAPELQETMSDMAIAMDHQFPGTITQVLDANFPFVHGFPLLPHLSHADGRKADIAFYYADERGYLPGATRSPMGYFAFEPGPSDCPKSVLTLRWDLAWLQNYWRDLTLDLARMTAALDWLSKDARIGKVFIEPHLKDRFHAQHDKIRFQGCRAARHDDHIHLQL